MHYCSLIRLFLIDFILLVQWWPFQNSQSKHLGCSHLATALVFPCTFRRPVCINQCKFSNPIFPSIKSHRSRYFCVGVRFWLALWRVTNQYVHFSMRDLIWVHQKVVSQFYQPIFQQLSYWNSRWHHSLFEVCCGPNSLKILTVVQ